MTKSEIETQLAAANRRLLGFSFLVGEMLSNADPTTSERCQWKRTAEKLVYAEDSEIKGDPNDH